MSRPARRQLIRFGRRSGDPETALRFHAVARLGAGDSVAAVATSLDIARSTVFRAGRRFVELGVDGLYDGRRNNGRRKVDATFRNRLVVLLRRSPEHFGWRRPTWTRELLCLQMVRDGRPDVSVCTMGRALASVGARLGSPKPVVLCPWAREARQRRLGELRALETRTGVTQPVLYADEVDIHLNPRIGRDWMLRGEQRRVRTPGKNEKFYIAGALDVRTGRVHTTGAARKNALLFCDLLRLIVAEYPAARRIHVVVDNYGIHSARVTQAQLAALRGRVVLHFLPPYCPDANRIERVWQDLHANVTRNHRCRSMRQLLENCHAYVEAYRWRRLTGVAALLRAA